MKMYCKYSNNELGTPLVENPAGGTPPIFWGMPGMSKCSIHETGIRYFRKTGMENITKEIDIEVNSNNLVLLIFILNIKIKRTKTETYIRLIENILVNTVIVNVGVAFNPQPTPVSIL